MADCRVDDLGDGRVDVVVVGAGLSGLVCARELTRQGLAVQVLEARESAGGRMRGHSSGLGLRLDLGGQWVGAAQWPAMGLPAPIRKLLASA
jgi:monoamine oxidase